MGEGAFELEVRTSHGGDSIFYSSFTAITVHFDFDLNCLQINKGMATHHGGGTKEHISKYNTENYKRSKGSTGTNDKYLHWFAFALCAGNSAKVGEVIKRSHFASL